jgi:hypothetical protein
MEKRPKEVKDMQKIGRSALCALLAMVFVAATMMPLASAAFTEDDEDYTDEIDATWLADAPDMTAVEEFDELFTYDSNISYTNFWFEPTSNHTDNLIWFGFANDAQYLYIYADICPDNTTDEDDYIMAVFDIDGDGAWDNDWDDMEPWYNIYGNMTISLGGNYPFIWYKGFEETAQEDSYEHRTWAMAIPIASLDAELGDTVEVYIMGYGTLAPEYQYPIENVDGGTFPDDLTFAQVTLADAPAVTPAEDTEAEQFADSATMWLILIGLLYYAMMVLAWGKVKEMVQGYSLAGEEWKVFALVIGIPAIIMLAAIAQMQWDWVGTLWGYF